ncbi:MAG: serine hydrolase domain-containing protein [Woeseiaceae bacterium]
MTAVKALALIAVFLLSPLSAHGASDPQSVLDDYRKSHDIPGISAVVVRDDNVVFSGATGFADLKSATPMSADSVIYIGSVSKVLTAVLVLQLVEGGKLSLDNPAGGLGRAVDDPPITVAHLLSHASGLRREGNFGYWFTADFPDGNSLQSYLERTTLRSSPGASLHYSNIGYAALGQIVEQVTEQSYGEALNDRVLKRLRMTASGGRGPAANPAMGYTPINRVLPSKARPFAGVGERVGQRHERSYHDARAMSPAFGAYSTANDMGKLASFLLGQTDSKVLSRAGRAQLYEPQASGRGLGLRPSRLNGRSVARHDGWFAAHRTHLMLDTENSVGVVVLANGDNASPGDIAEALLEEVLRTDVATGRND